MSCYLKRIGGAPVRQYPRPTQGRGAATRLAGTTSGHPEWARLPLDPLDRAIYRANYKIDMLPIFLACLKRDRKAGLALGVERSAARRG
jgi:hypothetical protein